MLIIHTAFAIKNEENEDHNNLAFNSPKGWEQTTFKLSEGEEKNLVWIYLNGKTEGEKNQSIEIIQIAINDVAQQLPKGWSLVNSPPSSAVQEI